MRIKLNLQHYSDQECNEFLAFISSYAKLSWPLDTITKTKEFEIDWNSYRLNLTMEFYDDMIGFLFLLQFPKSSIIK